MKRILFTLCLLLATLCSTGAKADTFEAGNGTFLLNGEPFIVKAAELHYPRIPRPYWEHRIQLCKALGMNTICIYVFWNIHEQRPGAFDFEDNNDVAEFVRLCQKHGLWVIVRPGPYVCAEWEMGGLPWWLLKKKDIQLRTQDPYFMERVKLFEEQVGKQLAPLTIQNGGPIIMVQVENEYGSYGTDKPYVSAIRDIVRESGFHDVTLFQCDWASNFTQNGLDDLLWTMNFGTGANIDKQFEKLKKLRPSSPLMCSEYWSGWFDKWGARHETRPAQAMVDGISQMLHRGISFSLYMTHGGTSFGHWAGANSPGFKPDVTSYDYDAPISEDGSVTPKYMQLRDTLARFSSRALPRVPKAVAKHISVPAFRATGYAPLEAAIDSIFTGPVSSFEDLDMGWGMMRYTFTSLPDIPVPSEIRLQQHDYTQVFLNGRRVGLLNRKNNQTTLQLPPLKASDRLELLVEGMGRINYGRAIYDRKGLVEAPVISWTTDQGAYTWSPLQMKHEAMPDHKFPAEWTDVPSEAHVPGFYRATFRLSKVGDTYLNLVDWGKGQVWVNGHAIGRFWSIGPQQTLYLPGCWLKKGLNEVVILDIAGPYDNKLFAQEKPELNRVHPHLRIRGGSEGRSLESFKDKLSDAHLVLNASLSPGNGWQRLKLSKAVKGRYLAIQTASTFDGGHLAIAELYTVDAKGEQASREAWLPYYTSSETLDGNHTADKAYDHQESTYWQATEARGLIVFDLGAEQNVTALDLLPRAEQGAPGAPKEIKVFVW